MGREARTPREATSQESGKRKLMEGLSENEDLGHLPHHKRHSIESGGQSDITSRVERVQKYIAKRSLWVGLPLPNKKEGLLNRNTTCTHIQFAENNIPLTLTDSGRVIENWVLQQTENKIVGFDLEWRPNFKKGLQNRTALLQLCTENGCLIIQMLYVDFIPEALVRFLKDPGVKLVGVGIGNDVAKLTLDHGLECKGEVELCPLAAVKLERKELKQVGLKGLAMAVLGLELSKPKKISMSLWDSKRLRQKQIEYACIDAFVSFAIGRKLLEPASGKKLLQPAN